MAKKKTEHPVTLFYESGRKLKISVYKPDGTLKGAPLHDFPETDNKGWYKAILPISPGDKYMVFSADEQVLWEGEPITYEDEPVVSNGDSPMVSPAYEFSESASAVKNETPKPPLGDIAGKSYEILKNLPKHKALTGAKITDELAEQYKIFIDETTLRKNHLPQLKPYGLYHKKRVGYCLR